MYKYPFAQQGIYDVVTAAKPKRPRIKKVVFVTSTRPR